MLSQKNRESLYSLNKSEHFSFTLFRSFYLLLNFFYCLCILFFAYAVAFRAHFKEIWQSLRPYNHHLSQAIARKTSPHFLPSPLPTAAKRFWILSPQLSFVGFPTSCRCHHSASFAYHSIFEIYSSFCAYWQFVAFYCCSISLCDYPFTCWWRFRLFLVGYYYY